MKVLKVLKLVQNLFKCTATALRRINFRFPLFIFYYYIIFPLFLIWILQTKIKETM